MKSMGWVSIKYGVEERCIQALFVEKTERKRPLERPKRRWEHNVKTAHQNLGYGHGLD
jgi:hypothetical protein